MERGERHLGGARQVELVLGQRVDLLLGVGQEAGAVQRLLAHEHRRDRPARSPSRRAARAPSARARARAARAGPSGRRSASPPRARPPPCRPGRRAGRGGRGRSCPASPTSRSTSSSSGAVGSGGFGTPASSGLQLLLDLADLGLELLHLRGHAAHLLDRGRCVAARALRLGDLVVGGVLTGAQLLEPRAAARAGARRARAARRARRRRRGARAPRGPAPGRAGSPLGRAPGGLASPRRTRRPSTCRGTRRPPRPPRRRRCWPA